MKFKPTPLQELIIYEKGMIEAWRHIKTICNLCIRAHKEEIKRLKSRKKI
jgi:hypothetical protein